MRSGTEIIIWRKLSITGFIGVLVYTLFVIVGGILWKGYSHVAQTISELTAYGAPGANVNLIITLVSGVLLIIFAYSVAVIFRTYKADRLLITGAILLISVEITSLISLNFFRQDLLGPLTSNQNITHFVVTGIMIICSIGSSFCLGISLRKKIGYKRIALFIFSCGIVITFFGVLIPISMLSRLMITGLIERIYTFTLQTWIAVLSIYLFRKS